MAPTQSSSAPVVRSRRHSLIRALCELAEDASARQREGAFVADGVRLIEEALHRRAGLEVVVTSPRLRRSDRGRALAAALTAGVGTVQATDEVIAAVVGATRHQGVVARVRMQAADMRFLADPERAPLLVVADGIQDPGNLGGLLRVAAAAGAGGLVAGTGSADPWGPKAVRASAGAVFHLPVRRDDGVQVMRTLGEAGYRSVAAVPHGGRPYDQLEWSGPTVLVLGAEGPGIGAGTLAAVDDRVSIPMEREMESLNVLAAATLLLYEARRHLGGMRRAGVEENPRRQGRDHT